jgi:transcriptional regulator with XRE-family HTH domain
MKSSRRVEGIALGITEARLDLDLSQRELALLSGVSATTIRRLEGGGRVHPQLIIRLAAALTVFELYAREGTCDERFYVVGDQAGMETTLATLIPSGQATDD